MGRKWLGPDPSADQDLATKEYVDDGLAGKASTFHTHDDRYYTETEVDALLDGLGGASPYTLPYTLQGVISSNLDTGGFPSFIHINPVNSNGEVGIYASSADPLVLAFADGIDKTTGSPKTHVAVIGSSVEPSAWSRSNLPYNITKYLYAEYDPQTEALSYSVKDSELVSLVGDNVPGMTRITDATISTNQNTADAGNMQDGDGNTKWRSESETKPHIITWDCGVGGRVATGIQFLSDSPSDYPHTWTVQGSNDQTHWTILLSVSEDPGDYPKIVKVFANTTSYRYYRMYVTKNDTNETIHWLEFSECYLLTSAGNNLPIYHDPVTNEVYENGVKKCLVCLGYAKDGLSSIKSKGEAFTGRYSTYVYGTAPVTTSAIAGVIFDTIPLPPGISAYPKALMSVSCHLFSRSNYSEGGTLTIEALDAEDNTVSTLSTYTWRDDWGLAHSFSYTGSIPAGATKVALRVGSYYATTFGGNLMILKVNS